MSKPRLISFKICPFVQRSVILLNDKGVEFDIDYIDLESPPAWFSALSPTGKVPVLVVDDTPLFESAIICEYLDEVYGESIHPRDPFHKAQNRAWVEFTSNLYVGIFKLMLATEAKAHEAAVNAIKKCLDEISKVKQAGPWFNGEAYGMVDVSVAPAFHRFEVVRKHTGFDILAENESMRAWCDQVMANPSVQNSVVSDFDEILISRMQGQGSYILQK